MSVWKRLSRSLAVGTLLAFATTACEEKKDPAANAASAKASATPVEEEEPEPPKPTGPPALVVDEIGLKVGFTTILAGKPDTQRRLDAELDGVKEHLDGKTLDVQVDRKTKIEWVMMMLDALAKRGATGFGVSTSTRDEYPSKLELTPASALSSPKPCSIVGMILEDRSTAVWQLSGGVANRRAKGMAGPDLTMTGETIERKAKACDSGIFFFSGDDIVEWGLAYDLAASTKTLKKASFDKHVLLPKIPTAGHEVEL